MSEPDHISGQQNLGLKRLHSAELLSDWFSPYLDLLIAFLIALSRDSQHLSCEDDLLLARCPFGIVVANGSPGST
jgi:hypothetical protein